MSHKKSTFSFFILFLTVLTIQVPICKGSMLSRVINNIAYSSLTKAISLRYQMFLKTKELNRLEKSYKLAFENKLKNTAYESLDNQTHKLFLKNYGIRKLINPTMTFKDKILKVLHGKEYDQQQEHITMLYDILCKQREDIYSKTRKEVYTQNYYAIRRNLLSSRRELNDQIPLKCLQKTDE